MKYNYKNKNKIEKEECKDMKSIILEGKGLGKTFKNGQVETDVIRNLDAEVYKGDFTVMMGTSGAGKSLAGCEKQAPEAAS